MFRQPAPVFIHYFGLLGGINNKTQNDHKPLLYQKFQDEEERYAMSSLPEEIYLEVLLRVPVKSTFVSKCVCRSWFYIISDPDFVKSHLNITTQRNKCSVMFKIYDDKNVYSMISFDSDESKVVKMDFPYRSLKYIYLLGSCNGLVYFWSVKMDLFFLWNPATKEYKRLPKLEDTRDYHRRLHGLAYDCKTEDYKLVVIKESISFQVYSLKSNSWKSFPSIPYGFPYGRSSGELFNGSLHWFGRIGKASSLMTVSKNISEEGFEELQLPMTLPMTRNYTIGMGVLEGCFCVHAYNKKTFEIWVLQDYRVLHSWTKLYTIMYESILYDSFTYVELLGSFKNGELLFRDTYNVISYDLKSVTTRKTKIDISHWETTVKYLESLVSLLEEGRRKKSLGT